MSYVNIPPNLQDMFYALLDRIAKLETGPNGAQTTADAAQSTANSAYSLAYTANSTATAAQTTANGKNKVTYSASTPSGSGTAAGDIWFQYTTGGVIIGQWTWNGSSWVSNTIDSVVIASLDAGKITAGTISVALGITNPSGNFTVNATTGYLTCSGANVTGTINANAGYISGWTIDSTGIKIPSLGNYINNAGTAVFSSVSTNSGNTNSFAGQITSLSDLVVYGSFNVLSNPSYLNTTTNVNAYMYYAGHPTTASSANAFINSSTGLVARSTSSLRYKVEVQEQDIPNDSVLALTSKSFIDKAQYEENGQKSDGLQRILGLIAEEVAEIPVLGDLLVNRNEQGQPDSVNYDRVAVALIPLIKELHNRVTVLEGK